MTNLFKRIISFSMVVVVSLSFCLAVSAAETVEDTLVVNSMANEGFPPYTDPDGYGSLTGDMSGVSSSYSPTYSFIVPEGGAYLYFAFNTNAMPKVTVRKNGVEEWSMTCLVTLGETKSVLMRGNNSPNGYWAAGTYTIKLAFNPQRYGQAYALDLWASRTLLPY